MEMMMMLVVAVCAIFHMAAPAPPWLPNGQTMADFKKFDGESAAEFNEMKNTVKEIKKLMVEKTKGHKMSKSDEEDTDEFIGDTLLTPDQATDMLEDLQQANGNGNGNGNRNRNKRKIFDFSAYSYYKWPGNSVPFKFDGTHDAADEDFIRSAIAIWEENTCLRFPELDTAEQFTDNHILITNQPSGCWSYVGRVPLIPQPLNLMASHCLSQVGTTLHEFGHAVGFFHEQTRPDRDSYMTVHTDNIQESRLSQYAISNMVDTGVPYDLGSVMQYNSISNAIDPNLPTMVASNPLLQGAMGQKSELTYSDIKTINLAYCNDICSALNCANSGYPNPNDCSSCLCPDGYSGALCDTVAPSDEICAHPDDNACTGPGSGPIQVTSDVETCFTMPAYSDNTRCNWKLEAASGCTIDVYYKTNEDFGVCSFSTPICYHWTEVKYKSDKSLRGARFCGDGTPDLSGAPVPGVLRTENNEAVVTLRSDYDTSTSTCKRGFTLCYKLSAQC